MSRVWGGTTLAARRTARRQRLVEVGLELLGTEGATAVTVRSVCRHAKLTDRYFYENFADRDEFLLAVYDQVADDARGAILRAVAQAVANPEKGGPHAADDHQAAAGHEAAAGSEAHAGSEAAAGSETHAGSEAAAVRPEVLARAAVEAFVGVLTDDPRRGRVLLREPMTDPTLGRRGVELMPGFAELIQGQIPGEVSPVAAQLTATALVGALANLFVRWLDGTLDVSRKRLVDYCVELLTATESLVRSDLP